MRGEKFMITKRSFLIMAFIAMITPVLVNAQTSENAKGWNARRIFKNTGRLSADKPTEATGSCNRKRDDRSPNPAQSFKRTTIRS